MIVYGVPIGLQCTYIAAKGYLMPLDLAFSLPQRGGEVLLRVLPALVRELFFIGGNQ